REERARRARLGAPRRRARRQGAAVVRGAAQLIAQSRRGHGHGEDLAVTDGALELSESCELQNGQLPGFFTSCLRCAPFGTSCTATVCATAPLSSRMMCTWPSPGSMKELFAVLAVYTIGLH